MGSITRTVCFTTPLPGLVPQRHGSHGLAIWNLGMSTVMRTKIRVLAADEKDMPVDSDLITPAFCALPLARTTETGR
jgi:hypothetical protein